MNTVNDRGARTSLTTADWRLLIGVAMAQIVAATALRVIPLPTLRAWGWRSRRLVHRAVPGSEARVIWAIEATGRRLGRLSTCLIQALVAELVIHGEDTPVLTIGVRRTATGTIEAHAWLVRSGRVLIGGTPDGYVPLVELQRPSA